ncbi:hypothetical protein KAW80_03580, partial [Candidatus Babeliales bacterium]|nr:hypothetical protein [Candidatus Babeliales bacterium]
ESIKNKEYRIELKKASALWRPWDRENSTESMQKYRDSGKELYADAISMLYNNPGLLEEVAPNFYQAYFESLENKPEMNEAYWALQDLLRGAKEELYKARENRIKKGFSRAEDIQKGFREKKEKADKRLSEKLRQQLDDRYYPALKKVEEAEANGIIIDDKANPKYLFQELAFIDNDNYLLVDKLDKEISQPIKEAGMTEDDIGFYLLLDRIQTGRKEIANPFGFLPSNAKEQLEYIEERVGKENFLLLKDKIKLFHDEVFKPVEKAVEVGSYNKEMFETTIEPNKYNYASFGVVDHLQEFVPATVKKQVGTLKDVANPYFQTILKTMALNKLNAAQEAKNSIKDLLLTNFPDEITPTKELRFGKYKRYSENKDNQLRILEDGKLKSYDVDSLIAKSFMNDHTETLRVATDLLGKFNQVFKSIVTTYNPGFSAFTNPIKDFKRNLKLIQSERGGVFKDEVLAFDLLVAYAKNLPSAMKYARGEIDDFTKDLIKNKAINAPIGEYNFDPRTDEMGAILKKFGIINKNTTEKEIPSAMKKARKFLLKPVISLLSGVRFTANTLESISKIAGAKVRMAHGESGKELYYNLRNYTGTPNWKTKGTATYITNEVFIFSNIMKEGIKSEIQIATNPTTRSGYWWKSAKYDLLPKFLMFLAAAGAFGDDLEDLYAKMSEYDKTNYITIPIGNKDGKAVYVRIPHDEQGRIFASILWKTLNAMKTGNINGFQQIFAIGAGQLPTVTPVITILGSWGQFLSGKNPYDSFRGRTLIDDTTFSAGGTPALKKMVKWTVNSFGLTQFTTYDPVRNDTMENIMQVTPILNRMIKISDYGITEESNKAQAVEEKIRSREIVREKEVITEYVNKYEDEYKSGAIDAYDIIEDVVEEILGREPETDDDFKREKSITNKLKRAFIIEKYDARFDSIVYGGSNKAKNAILAKYKKDLSIDKFKELIDNLYDEGIISAEVYDIAVE